MTGEPTEIPGERGISPLSGGAAAIKTKRMIGAGVVIAFSGIMLYLTLTSSGGEKKPSTDANRRPPSVQQTIDFKPAPGPEKSTIMPVSPLAKQREPLPTELAMAAVGREQPKPQGGLQQPDPAAKIRQEGIESPVMAVNGGGEHGAATPAVATQGAGGEADQSALAARLKATRMTGSLAATLPDRDFLITQSTHIPCVLETAMDSTIPGFTKCDVPVDVLSDNGHVVLLDKGTKIFGQYQADMKQGQSRIFVLWTRAETPTGVIIDISSPATDALGRAGFDGQVDTHFWERFGGAILLSVIDDGMATLQASQQQSGTTTISTSNSSAAAQSTASTALQNTINIPPTLIKNQGEEVAVIVARDLDFASVYKLREATH